MPGTDDAADPVVDLLGVLACGELCAFDRLAADARMAPSLTGRVALSRMATVEFGHYRQLTERLCELGTPPERAMAPFVQALESYHAMTAPSTWLEGLVKVYLGDGMAADFYREVAEFVDPSTRSLILRTLADTGNAEFVVREVRAAIAGQPSLAGPLALWGRRLVGEAISQSEHVLAERDALTALLVQGQSGLSGLGGVAALFRRITDQHGVRMRELGLHE